MLTAVAVALVVAAEGWATLSPTASHTHHVSHPRKVATHAAREPYEGEPQPAEGPTARAPWTAAVRFVRDYAVWEAGRLTRLPSRDATKHVIELLEHAGPHRLGATRDAARSVRMAASGEDRYVATSAVGNFLIGRRGARWLAVSAPGD